MKAFFALLSIDLWLERRRIGWLVALAAAIALQALACVYLGFFAIVLTPVYAAVQALRYPPRRLLALGVGLIVEHIRMAALLAEIFGESIPGPHHLQPGVFFNFLLGHD